MNVKICNKILSINIYDAPSIETWGVLNRTVDGYYLPFFDFDGVRLDVVREAAHWLNINFKLGPMLIRKSSSFLTKEGVEIGSYHLIGFSKLTLPKFEHILSRVWCDKGFKMGFRLEPERAWVLRVASKIDLETKKIIKPFCTFADFCQFKTSKILNSGVFNFFQKLDKFKVRNKYKMDNLDELYLIRYWGKEKLKKKELIKLGNRA